MGTDSETRIYANAAFETALNPWLGVLEQVADALNRKPGLRSQLSDESRSFEDRQAMLLALLPKEVSEPVRNFLLAMLANGDITLLHSVVAELSHMAAAAGGPRPILAEVTSAVELSAQERAAIQEKLVNEFGTKLELRFQVDPAILGGLVIRVGDKLLDTSVASRLAAMRQSVGLGTS